VEDCAGTLSRRTVTGDEDVASALRELIAAVIVHPAERDEPRIEVRGRLAQLIGAPELFPQQQIPRTVVAGARNTLNAHNKIGRFQLTKIARR
jgi:hypothetical protein